MKKCYLQPVAQVYDVNSGAVLAALSSIEYGGSNSGQENPTAEAKSRGNLSREEDAEW